MKTYNLCLLGFGNVGRALARLLVEKTDELRDEFGIALSPRQTRKYLGRIAAWRRTVRTLQHKQDPVKVERATAVLGSLQKRRSPAPSGSSISMSAASARASQ